MALHTSQRRQRIPAVVSKTSQCRSSKFDHSSGNHPDGETCRGRSYQRARESRGYTWFRQNFISFTDAYLLTARLAFPYRKTTLRRGALIAVQSSTGRITLTKSPVRRLLLSSVSAAVGVFLLPASVHAQATTCSQAGTTITCNDGATQVLTATTTPGTNTVAGPGLVTIDTTTSSTTTYVERPRSRQPWCDRRQPDVDRRSRLIFVPAGGGARLDIKTIGGVGANGLQLNTAGQAATVTVGDITTRGVNSFGVLSTGGTDLTLRAGNITTQGATSTAIDAGLRPATSRLLLATSRRRAAGCAPRRRTRVRIRSS